MKTKHKQLLEEWEGLKELPNNLLKELTKGAYFKTGSDAFFGFGSYYEGSNDYDFVVLVPSMLDMADILIKNGYGFGCSEFYDGNSYPVYCKVPVITKPVNFILVENKDVYDAWQFATDTMVSMCRYDVMNEKARNDRQFRVNVFSYLRELYKEVIK